MSFAMGTPCAALLPRSEVPTARGPGGETLLEIAVRRPEKFRQIERWWQKKRSNPWALLFMKKNELLIPLKFAEILEFSNLELLFN